MKKAVGLLAALAFVVVGLAMASIYTDPAQMFAWGCVFGAGAHEIARVVWERSLFR